jgi:excisionase family DNA binding protein
MMVEQSKILMDVSEPNQSEKQLRKVEREDRLAYSIPEAAELLGVDYFSVYRLVQRGKLKACRALRGKFLITRVELNRLLNSE